MCDVRVILFQKFSSPFRYEISVLIYCIRLPVLRSRRKSIGEVVASQTRERILLSIVAGPLDFTQEGAALCYVIGFIFTFVSLAPPSFLREPHCFAVY